MVPRQCANASPREIATCTTSGSFSWQTLAGTFSTPTDFVGNDAPYRWYAADVQAAISPGDAHLLLRIRSGPSSGTLVVNKIELCLDAS